jgi:CxxC-x17-CxxC domain-containing protein
MTKGPRAKNDSAKGDSLPDLASKPTPVLLTKRTPVAPPDPKAPRDKICSECGMHFKLESGQKFYLCPDCYRRSFVYKRNGGKDVARILTHITCAGCGAQEYLPFIPDDPTKALCRTCYAAQRPEQKSPNRHPHR